MLTRKPLAAACGLAVVTLATASGQNQPAAKPGATQEATVETASLELIPPDRFQIPVILTPIRRVVVRATGDGIVREVRPALGATVRGGDLVARLDPAEERARVAIAEAELKRRQAEVEGARSVAAREPNGLAAALAEVQAAQARLELAKLALQARDLASPIDGRIIAVAVDTGQFVQKGETIAEIADASTVGAVVPIRRDAAKPGSEIELSVEGETAKGSVRAILPLPESYSTLRELATPWVAAVVDVPNPDGRFEPGRRVRPPSVPESPVTAVDERAIKGKKEPDSGSVQVIRDDRVVTVPVRLLGPLGPGRVQVSGPLRESDAVVVSSSLPLAEGTYIRFGARKDQGAPGTSPKPAGGQGLPKEAVKKKAGSPF